MNCLLYLHAANADIYVTHICRAFPSVCTVYGMLYTVLTCLRGILTPGLGMMCSTWSVVLPRLDRPLRVYTLYTVDCIMCASWPQNWVTILTVRARWAKKIDNMGKLQDLWTVFWENLARIIDSRGKLGKKY